MSVDDEPRKDATGETGYPRRLEELADKVAALDEDQKAKLRKLVDEYSKLKSDNGLFVIADSTNGVKYPRCRVLAEKAALVAAIHDLVIERDSCRKRIDDYAHLFLIHWDPAQLAIRRLNEFGDPAILELDMGLKMLFGTKGRNRRAAKKRVRKIIAANSRPRLRRLSQLRQLQADLEETEADWVKPAHNEGRCRSMRLRLLKDEVDAWMLQPPPDDDWRRVGDAWAAVEANLGVSPPADAASDQPNRNAAEPGRTSDPAVGELSHNWTLHDLGEKLGFDSTTKLKTYLNKIGALIEHSRQCYSIRLDRLDSASRRKLVKDSETPPTPA